MHVPYAPGGRRLLFPYLGYREYALEAEAFRIFALFLCHRMMYGSAGRT
jgi:hypothetical protein